MLAYMIYGGVFRLFCYDEISEMMCCGGLKRRDVVSIEYVYTSFLTIKLLK